MTVMRWLLVLELALSGCSFTLAGPAAHRPRNQPPACDTSKGMVVVDSLIATSLGIATIGEAGSSDNSTSATLVPLALGAAFLGAAIYGYRLTSACDRANADYHLAQLENAEPMPNASGVIAAPAVVGPAPIAHAVVAPAPVAPAPVEPTVAAPVAPAVVAPATPVAPPAPRPQPAPPPPALDDRWPAFWRVIP